MFSTCLEHSVEFRPNPKPHVPRGSTDSRMRTTIHTSRGSLGPVILALTLRLEAWLEAFSARSPQV